MKTAITSDHQRQWQEVTDVTQSVAARRFRPARFHRPQIGLGASQHDLVDGARAVVEAEPELGHVQTRYWVSPAAASTLR